MKHNKQYNRRSFIKLSAAGAVGGIPIVSSANNIFQGSIDKKPLKIYVFSKTLQFLDYDEMSKVVKEIGFDGIDLTVRSKGHVLPENVATDLPKATKAMQKAGLLTDMITTKVVDPTNKTQVKVLEVAKESGYSLYRTNWLKYPKDTPVKETLVKYKEQLQALAKLNAEIGITGAYQNHAGHYFGAPIWDLEQALKGISKKDLGIQFDIMHATVEGAQSWQIGFELVKEQINSLVIKDFKWVKEEKGWKRRYTPLGEGMVDFDAYFKFLRTHNIHLPVSLHFEYDLSGADKGKVPTIKKEIIYEKMKKDLLFVREAWAKSGDL